MTNILKFPSMYQSSFADSPWAVTLASHWDAQLKKNIPDAIEHGFGLEDLLDHVETAYKAGINIEVSFDIDPTPQFLYDNTGGEPAFSADERWQRDFDQKQSLTA